MCLILPVSLSTSPMHHGQEGLGLLHQGQIPIIVIATADGCHTLMPSQGAQPSLAQTLVLAPRSSARMPTSWASKGLVAQMFKCPQAATLQIPSWSRKHWVGIGLASISPWNPVFSLWSPASLLSGPRCPFQGHHATGLRWGEITYTSKGRDSEICHWRNGKPIYKTFLIGPHLPNLTMEEAKCFHGNARCSKEATQRN